MEKAIETDWRCQSTTWKFLQKVVIAVYWQKKDEKTEKSFSLLNFWCARSPIQTHMKNTHTIKHHVYKNICGQIESMTVSNHAHHIIHSPLSLMLSLCFAQALVGNRCKLILAFVSIWNQHLQQKPQQKQHSFDLTMFYSNMYIWNGFNRSKQIKSLRNIYIDTEWMNPFL